MQEPGVGHTMTEQAEPGAVAVEQDQPGHVVLAACATEREDGFFGEPPATSLRARGALGLVIDGGCRDIAGPARLDFPALSGAIHAKGTVKASPGSVNVLVVCANVLVNPGDGVLADADGVVVVPAAKAVRTGELGLDIYQMRDDPRPRACATSTERT